MFSYTASLELSILENYEVVFDTWPRGEEEIHLVLARLKTHRIVNIETFLDGRVQLSVGG